MDAQDVIALTLVVAALVYLGRTFQRQVQGRSGCGCAHAGKGSRCGAVNRLPLLTPESVGRPFPTVDERSATPASQQEEADKQHPGASAADPHPTQPHLE